MADAAGGHLLTRRELVRSAAGALGALTRAARRLQLSPRLTCWMEGPHRWPWLQWMGEEGNFVASTGLWLPSARTAGNGEFVQGFRARFGREYSMEMLGTLPPALLSSPAERSRSAGPSPPSARRPAGRSAGGRASPSCCRAPATPAWT